MTAIFIEPRNMPPNSRIATALTALALYLCAAPATSCLAADAIKDVDVPLWEYGVGGGAVAFPVYRGSDVARAYPIVVPYVVYHGEVLRSDRSGVSAVFKENRWFRLDFSENASPPVSSSASSLRNGMPSLKPTVEFGPALNFWLWRSSDDSVLLSAQFPARYGVSIGSSPKVIGHVESAFLNLDVLDPLASAGWSFGARVGPMFQSQRYNDYFYGVAPQYATPNRPQYDPKGGYAGAQALVSLSKRFDKVWVGAYLRYDTLRGAVFDGSPLVATQTYWAGGFGFAWVLGVSKERVVIDRARL